MELDSVDKLIPYTQLWQILSAHNGYIITLMPLTRNKVITELRSVLTQLGFPPNIGDHLLSDPIFWAQTRDIIGHNLRSWKQAYMATPEYLTLQDKADYYQGLEFSHQHLSLFDKLFLSIEDPQVIRILEERHDLPQTGNYEKLIDNYHKKFYTQSCLADHNPNFCLIQAAKRGDIEIFKLALKSDSTNYVAALEAILQVPEPLQGEHIQIFQILLRKINKNMIDLEYRDLIGKARENGHEQLAQLLIQDAKDHHRRI